MSYSHARNLHKGASQINQQFLEQVMVVKNVEIIINYNHNYTKSKNNKYIKGLKLHFVF
jgi:hypothetical protein